MANANVTVTVDTASSPWVYPDGRDTTVSSNDQTFVMRLIDLGTTADYIGGGVSTDDCKMNLADGETVTICRDKRFVHLGTFANTVAKTNPGSLWVKHDCDDWQEVKVTTATIADADATGVNNITTITFEYPGKPWQWTWTNIKTA